MSDHISNEISDVCVDQGDIFIGNKVQYEFNFEPPNIDSDNLIALVNKFKDLHESDEGFLEVREELENYQEPIDSRKIYGVEAKLKKAGREDLIDAAIREKDKFAKRLLKYQLSSHKSALHLHILSEIEECFNTQIFPLIRSGEPFEVIDLAISNVIIRPIAKEVSVADPTLTAKQVRGMMYLLTGNCYLRWFEQ